jgi:hypothetical protein
MKDIVITKEHIIKALKTEELKQGDWVAKAELPVVGNCAVCAVGAVLRHINLPNNEIYTVANSLDTYGYPAYLHTEEDKENHRVEMFNEAGTMWLWVLSDIFEEAATAREGRDAVIAFVKKHCKKDKIIPGDFLEDMKESARSSIYFYAQHADGEDVAPTKDLEKMTDKDWAGLYTKFAKELGYKGRSRKFKPPKMRAVRRVKK